MNNDADTIPHHVKIRSLLGQLPPDLLDDLLRAGSARLFKDGQTIQLRGDMRHDLSIIESGAVRMGAMGTDGKFINTVILRQGESFGELTLFAQLPRALDAQAMGPTRINFISQATFMRIFDAEPLLRQTVLAHLASQLARSLDQIDSILRLPLPAQIARLLRESILAHPGQSSISVKITHDQLAATMGVSRLSIARALDVLVDLKLVEKAYGALIVPSTVNLIDWMASQSTVEPIYS